MGKMSLETRIRFANYIVEEIKKEFDTTHLSGNLADTIYIENDGDAVRINIPAEMYDLKLYKENRIILYTGQGSYASSVDSKGGFSKKHKNFVDNCINKATERISKECGVVLEVKR